MKNHRFTATAPDGTVCTRSSKTKSYEYAVLVNDEITPTYHTIYDENGAVASRTLRTGWGSWSWSGSFANARKAADQARKCYFAVEIVPVNNPRPKEDA